MLANNVVVAVNCHFLPPIHEMEAVGISNHMQAQVRFLSSFFHLSFIFLFLFSFSFSRSFFLFFIRVSINISLGPQVLCEAI